MYLVHKGIQGKTCCPISLREPMLQTHIPVFMKEQYDLCPRRIEYCCNPTLRLKLDRLGYTPFSHLVGMCRGGPDMRTDQM